MIAPPLHDKNDLYGSKMETKMVQQTLANVSRKLASPCYKNTATTLYMNN